MWQQHRKRLFIVIVTWRRSLFSARTDEDTRAWLEDAYSGRVRRSSSQVIAACKSGRTACGAGSNGRSLV